ncbi:DUF6542 domain-containing protein [Corynebacterium sp. L4756]|uniref:DUF6542 domain-containing protein n=1 Tax=unclassified Corynebacterium TaxID=2624378 RepID=UPI00374CC9AE
MSHVNTQSHPVNSRAGKGFGALPVWTSIAVIVAALATGLIISTITSSVGWPFLICFILGALAATALVQVRGLFLTVASIPLLFALMMLLTSWLTVRSTQSEGAPLFSTTIVVTSAYPLLEVFPHLAFTLVACIIIAVLRLYRVKNSAQSINSNEQVSRRKMAESDRRNRETTSRARETTKRLSVQELIERNKSAQSKGAATRAPRPEAGSEARSATRSAARNGSAAESPAPGSTSSRSARSATSIRRGSASSTGSAREVRRVPRTDESRRSSRTSRPDASTRDPRRDSSARERATRRVTDAQQNQEQARRSQSFDNRHATDSRRPDPRRRAGDAATAKQSPASSAPAQPAQQPASERQPATEQLKKQPKPQTRKRASRALDEDLYGN